MLMNLQTKLLISVAWLVPALVLGADSATPAKIASPYKTDHKAPLDAKVELIEKKETHSIWRVEFNGIAGDRVPGNLYLPAKIEGRRPAVLVQHGIGDRKTAEYITSSCRFFAELGVIALAIDAPNRGERLDNNRKVDLTNIPAVHDWFRQHCGDYSRAYDYLESRADVDRGRLGYMGFSWGAITGVTYVAHDPRVSCMASIVGGGNLVGYLGLPGKGGAGTSLDPAHHVAAIAPRPLLMVNGRRDIVILPMFAKALHQAAGEGSKVIWHDTDHVFSGVDRPTILLSVCEFVRDHLPKKP
ncbi:MAG: hypothetical protein EXS24_04340 [Pedosphaera sp.]|nr:hypothetical protein [Pedosphaera sp.]